VWYTVSVVFYISTNHSDKQENSLHAADRREAVTDCLGSVSRCVVYRLCACKLLCSSLLAFFHLSFPLQRPRALMHRIVQPPSSIARDAFCERLIGQSQKPLLLLGADTGFLSYAMRDDDVASVQSRLSNIQ